MKALLLAAVMTHFLATCQSTPAAATGVYREGNTYSDTAVTAQPVSIVPSSFGGPGMLLSVPVSVPVRTTPVEPRVVYVTAPAAPSTVVNIQYPVWRPQALRYHRRDLGIRLH